MISNGKLGGKSELLVCADLLEQGYEVFRSVTQSTSTDLIRLKNNIMERVEVRTKTLNYNNPQHALPVQLSDFGRFDILAVVTYQNNTTAISYFTHAQALDMYHKRRGNREAKHALQGTWEALRATID